MSELKFEVGESLVAFAKKLGENNFFVQGAGGNLSWKKEGVLWVKASGKWMANLTLEDGFVAVNLELAKNIEKAVKLSPLDVSNLESTLKPSIETSLHAVMPQRFVVHLHHIKSIVELVRHSPEKRLCELQGLKNWGFIGYEQPGIQLTKKVVKYLSKNSSCDQLFLANHGIVVGSDTIEGIEKKLISLDEALLKIQKEQRIVHYDPEFSLLEKDFQAVDGVTYRLSKNGTFHYLARDAKLLSRLRDSWALYPDHVVFLGRKPWIIEPSELSSGRAEFPVNKRVPFLFVPHHGVLEREDLQPSEAEQLQCYYEVISRVLPGEKLTVLSNHEVDKLLNWDAEKYRRSIAPQGEA